MGKEQHTRIYGLIFHRGKWIYIATLFWLASGVLLALEGKDQDPPRNAEGTYISPDQALQRMIEKNPEVQILRAEVEVARAHRQKSQLLLPANPRLDLSATDGRRKLASVIDGSINNSTFKNEQGISGYEVGLQQEIEIAGQRGLRKEATRSEVEATEKRFQHQILLLSGQLRRVYYHRSSFFDISEHLKEHLQHLQSIRARMGTTFRDPRLGAYVKSAIEADIATLESETAEAQIAYLKADQQLKQMIGLDPDAVIRTEEVDAMQFRALPPLQTFREATMGQRHDLQAAQKEMDMRKSLLALEQRKLFGAPTLYLYGGRTTFGNSSLNSTVIGPQSERETYIRAGITIPIPVVDTNAYGKREADARLVASENELERMTRQALGDVTDAYQRYSEKYHLLPDIMHASERLHTNRAALAEALLRGRISYFEFWSEHERLHSMTLLYHSTFLDTLDALSDLEIMSGIPLSPQGLKEINIETIPLKHTGEN